jgi:hypothetical protein
MMTTENIPSQAIIASEKQTPDNVYLRGYILARGRGKLIV